jgi:ribosomal-protein-alanine acetyltransferase/tRNA threonylcarbamoyl adenosine modification protein YeaZ
VSTAAAGPMFAQPGLVIESATAHVEVLVCAPDGAALAHEAEDVGHGHTRRLTPLVMQALARARIEPRALGWIAADLGPGSFTGVRVGLATAEALALAAGAPLLGASSLTALALSSRAGRALVVPLVPGGRHDLYAGFFRADLRGRVTLLAAPRVAGLPALSGMVTEARALLPRASDLRFVGPGAAREREALERFAPGSTGPAKCCAGLSAADLAVAVRSGLGPAAGLPAPGEEPRPLYVRSAQAEERVRRAVLAGRPIRIRDFAEPDLPAVAAVERRVFSDAWPESFFREELSQAMAWARIAEADGALAGYLLAWVGGGAGHIGNLAVVPEARRRGVARALLEDLLEHAGAAGAASLTLEVRVSNFAAQALYRAFGFRLAGLRRGYYRDTGEDALIMAWTAADAKVVPAAPGRGGPAQDAGMPAGRPTTSNSG